MPGTVNNDEKLHKRNKSNLEKIILNSPLHGFKKIVVSD